MSLGRTAQKKKKKKRKRKVEKDLTFLFNLRFSRDAWPLSVMKGRGGLVQTLEDRCQSVLREHAGTITVLESDGRGKLPVFQNTRQIVVPFTQTQKRNQLRYTLHNYKH